MTGEQPIQDDQQKSGSHANRLHDASVSWTGIIIIAALIRLEYRDHHNSEKSSNRNR